MSSHSQPPPGRRRRPPPAKPQAPAPTTIRDLGDDLLLQIFLHLPSLPSLVRAALTCRSFLAAVRSSPTFRRRFIALHDPPLLGLFLGPNVTDVSCYAPLRRGSDPDFAAAVRGSDLFIAGFPDEIADAHPGCHLSDCSGGYVLLLLNWQLPRRLAAYNPLTRALEVFSAPPDEVTVVRHRQFYLNYHILASDEAPGSFRVVSICRNGSRLRAAVFSSGTREWQVLPWTRRAPTEQWGDQQLLSTGALVDASLYVSHVVPDYTMVLNTATLQFSWVHLPDQLKGEGHIYRTGTTKDGRLCLVSVAEFTLSIWLLQRADADVAQRWMLDSVIPLEGEVLRAVKGTHDDVDALKVWAILEGVVHLSIKTSGDDTCWFLSFCLETRKLENIFRKTFRSCVCPYIMAWPPSLVGNGEMA